MAMPTDDERREVAAGLRKLAARYRRALGRARIPRVMADAQNIMGTFNLPSVAHVLERYADLMEPEEPTCRWVSVDDRLPECRGEYIVAYHPCFHRDIDYGETRVGIDSFMVGKASWVGRKYQRVTHWMQKPELPEAVEGR